MQQLLSMYALFRSVKMEKFTTMIKNEFGEINCIYCKRSGIVLFAMHSVQGAHFVKIAFLAIRRIISRYVEALRIHGETKIRRLFFVR